MYNKNSVEINIASIAICHVEKNHENVFDLELVKGNKVYSLVFFVLWACVVIVLVEISQFTSWQMEGRHGD